MMGRHQTFRHARAGGHPGTGNQGRRVEFSTKLFSARRNARYSMDVWAPACAGVTEFFVEPPGA